MVTARCPSHYVLADAGKFLALQWSPGAEIEASDIESVLADVNRASLDGRRPLLVHIGLAARISIDAKRLITKDTSSARIAIVGVDQVGRVLTAFHYKSATPSKYFDDEDEALMWLLDGCESRTGSLAGSSTTPQDEAPTFSSEIRDGVLWVSWNRNTSITESLAAEFVEQLNLLSPTSCPPMLAQLNEMVSVSDEAMHIMASGLNIAALAVAGSTPGDREITTYYRRRCRPPHPTRHFDTVEEANTWLMHARL